MSIPFIMSPEDHAKFEIEWAVRLARLDVPALTAGQQLALFRLRKSALSEAIVETLQSSTVRASAADYSDLVKRGWLQRNRYTSLHEITIIGRNQADNLARKAARELGVHFFVTRGGQFQTSVACTCGKWSYSHSRNEGHERTAFARRAAEHLEKVGQQRAGIIAGPMPDVTQQEEGRADG